VSRLRRLLFLFLVIITKHILKLALEFLEERHCAVLFFVYEARIESAKENRRYPKYEFKVHRKRYEKLRVSVAKANNTPTGLIYSMTYRSPSATFPLRKGRESSRNTRVLASCPPTLSLKTCQEPRYIHVLFISHNPLLRVLLSSSYPDWWASID
jgi:hypothetical protein